MITQAKNQNCHPHYFFFEQQIFQKKCKSDDITSIKVGLSPSKKN